MLLTRCLPLLLLPPQAAASEMGVDVAIPPKLCSITTVGQFQQLVMLSEANAQMRKVVSGLPRLPLPLLCSALPAAAAAAAKLRLSQRRQRLRSAATPAAEP